MICRERVGVLLSRIAESLSNWDATNTSPRRLTAFSAAILLFALASSPCLAQINTATIAGSVRDPTGANVPGATVVVENVASGVRRGAQTNSDGVYSVPLLQPGQYTVTISKDGFQTSKNSGVDLVISQVATLNVTLTLGTAAQEVTVSGAVTVPRRHPSTAARIEATFSISMAFTRPIRSSAPSQSVHLSTRCRNLKSRHTPI